MRLWRTPEWIFLQLIWLVFAIATAIFRHHGLSYFDASEFATHIQGSGIAHAPGYPLYILLGKLVFFITGDPFTAQFLIALASSWICVAFLYLSLKENPRAAVLTVLLFLSSYLVKLYTVLPEVFLLNLALTAGLVFSLKRFAETKSPRALAWIGLIYGLGFCHQHLLALSLPAALAWMAWSLKRAPSLKEVRAFTGGALLGVVPSLYLFVASQPEPDYTYHIVHTFSDFLFVVLRQGYGTLQMTFSFAATPWTEVLAFSGDELTRSLGVGVVFLLLGAMARPRALFWFALSTAIFTLGFLSFSANIPLDIPEGRATFARLLTFPGFLLLYPAYHGFIALLERRPQAFVFFAGLILASNVFYASHFNFRSSPFLEYQIEEGFRTVARQVPASPVAEIDSRYNRCVVFGNSDAHHFGGRYYNEFKAERRCFFFARATNTRHFDSKAELKLMEKYGENNLRELFRKILSDGYRVFFLYQPDTALFGSDVYFNPVGNIVEITFDPTKQNPNAAEEYAQYLNSLNAMLDRSSKPAVILDRAAIHAPFSNLQFYRQLLPQAAGIDSTVQEKILKIFGHPMPD